MNSPNNPNQLSPLTRRVMLHIAAAAAYFILAWAAIIITRESGRIASIWLANAVLLSIALNRQRTEWFSWLFAGFIGNLAANLTNSDPLPQALVLSLCNTIEVAIALVAIKWNRGNQQTDLTLGREYLRFTGFGVALPAILTGAIASGYLHFMADTPFWLVFRTWSLADGIGLLTIVPLLQTVSKDDFQNLLVKDRILEFLSVATLSTVPILFAHHPSQFQWLFLMVPISVWASTSLNATGGALSIFLVTCSSLLSLYLTAQSGITGSEFRDQTVRMQILIVVCSLSTVPVASLLRSARASESRYRDLFGFLPLPVWVIDQAEGKFLNVNQGAEAFFGYTKSEFFTMRVTDLCVTPGHHDETSRHRKVSDLPTFDTVHYRRKNGQVAICEVHYDRLLYQGRDAQLVIIEDVTDKKTAEQQRELLAAIVEVAPNSIVVRGFDTSVRYANQRTGEIHGMTVHEFTSTPLNKLDTPAAAAKINERLAALQTRGEAFFEVEHFRKDGSTLPLAVYAKVIHWQGEPAILTVETDLSAIRSAEESRRISEERYRLIAESASDVVWVLDPHAQRFTYVSPSVDRQRGYSPEEVMAMPFEESIPPEMREQAAKWMMGMAEQVANGGSNIAPPRILPQTHKDGSVVWTEISSTWLLDQNRQVTSIVGVTRDITDRMKGEADLRESEEKFRSIAEQLHDVIYMTDREGIITYQSPATEKMFGIPVSKIVGKPFIRNIPIPDREAIASQFRRFIEEAGEPRTFPIQMHRADGSIVETELSAALLRKGGQVVGTVGMIRNVTERNRLDRAIRESEERLQESQRIARIGGYDLDTSSGQWSSSPTMDDIFGIDTEFNRSVEGWLTIVHPEDRQAMQEYFLQKVMTEHLPFDREYRIQRIIDGETRWVHGLGRLQIDDLGRVTRMYGTIQDITEHKLAEIENQKLTDQLVQAQKMDAIGKLAGGVAHDFNNMLMAILGNAELALDAVNPDSPEYWGLQEIIKAARRSADLTGQLLAFARKQTIVPRIVDLNDCIEGLLKMLRRLVRENIHLHWNPSPGLHPIKIDPVQIDQLLANLVVNAKDAIAEQGLIVLNTYNVELPEKVILPYNTLQPGPYVMLTITDTGSGIASSILPKIFDPFFTTKEQGKGTGIGLSTVMGIVQQNDGAIDVNSNPGEGTTFTIYLPAYPSEKIPSVSVTKLTEIVGGTETILITEDEPSILYVAQSSLQKLGYKVLTAGRPEDALRIASDHRIQIDLLLSDVVMPGMDGPTLATHLKTVRPNLKTIFMSGYSSDVSSLDTLLSGGAAFIQKPFPVSTLAGIIRKELDSGG